MTQHGLKGHDYLSMLWMADSVNSISFIIKHRLVT